MIQKNWQELIKPNKLEVAPGDDPKRVATVVAEPLERGFGTTLGNSLRRVLLSSLQGAAVTSIHIDGVLHEFSSIPGVREDVTDIVLNVKNVAIRMQGEGAKRMTLRKTGPGVVTAGDINTVGDVQILNPELVLCTLDEGAEIRMEFTVDMGKGYVPAERNRAEDAPIGLIPVDSLYSPVKKVSYRIENTREGQILDYDKLIMTVETNGSISPGRCGRLCGAHPAGPASGLRQLRRAPQGRDRDRCAAAAVQPCAAQEGRRARAVGPFGELPEERQHRLYRRPDPEDRKPRCCARRISAASRSTRSRKFSPPWVSISAWTCRAGRPRTSKTSRSVSKSTTKT